MNNTIKTWAQGHFVDQQQYRHWGAEAKDDANKREELLVRPGPTDNAVCRAYSPDAAEWIAQRLNVAANLEALVNKLHTADAMTSANTKVACSPVTLDQLVEQFLLPERIDKYLGQLAPHVANREAAKLLREAMEELQRYRRICNDSEIHHAIEGRPME